MLANGTPRPPLSPFVLIKQSDADEPGFVADYAHGCDPVSFTNEEFASKTSPTLHHDAFRAEPDRRFGGRGRDHRRVKEHAAACGCGDSSVSLHQTDWTVWFLYSSFTGRYESVHHLRI